MTATPQYGSDLVVDLFRVVGITARGDQSRREGPTLTICVRAAPEIRIVINLTTRESARSDHPALAAEARGPADIDRAFSDMTRARAGGLVVWTTAMFVAERRRLVALAAKHRPPAV
jgi:hypothetical protein